MFFSKIPVGDLFVKMAFVIRLQLPMPASESQTDVSSFTAA
jgi:hypothetical protein